MNEPAETLTATPELLKLNPKQSRNFWGKVDFDSSPKGCWLWIGSKCAHGYGFFGVKGKLIRTHRLSWLMHRGPIPDDVLHRCDNPPCVNPDHLFTGTHSDNMQDMVRKGRNKFPDNSGDNNWSRRMPELIKRGDNHWSHKRPDCVTKGVKHGNAKITPEIVLKIRILWGGGNISQPKIAARFGISQSNVSGIVNGKSWTHVA